MAVIVMMALLRKLFIAICELLYMNAAETGQGPIRISYTAAFCFYVVRYGIWLR
jgi:hypothetical protein